MPSIVKGLFADPEKPLKNYTPSGFSSGGLTGSFARGPGGGTYNVTRTNAANQALGNVRTSLLGQASELGALRPMVAPGFGRLTEARMKSLDANRRRTVGNLREELSKRRVLGSSFGQAQVAGTEAEFAMAEGQMRAESFLQELGLTQDLINQEYGATTAAMEAELSQLNFESGVAAQLGAAAQGAMQANTMARAQLLGAQQAASTNFFGDLLGFGLGKLFGGPGGKGKTF